MKNIYSQTTLLLGVVAVFLGCAKKDSSPKPASGPLAVSESQLKLGADGGSRIINVTATGSWGTGKDAGWITVGYPGSGTNNGSFNILVEANTGADRTGNITVNAGNETKTITVEQAGPKNPTGGTGGTGGGTGGSSGGSGGTGGTGGGSGGTGGGTGSTGGTGGGTGGTGGGSGGTGGNSGGTGGTGGSSTPLLSVSPYSISIHGSSPVPVTVGVASNVAWTVSTPPAYLSVTPMSGTGNQQLTITASANPTPFQRTATITVRHNTTLFRTITVNQYGK